MIDLLFYLLVCMAIVQGWRKGLIIALLSLVCGLIGLTVAVKFSAVIATHLHTDLHLRSRWLPLIAFILVFILVLLLIRALGRLLENLLKLAMLNWLNKLGGILLYLVLFLSIYSIILFYGTQMQVISKQTVEESRFFPAIAPLGPSIIRFITGHIPYGQDMFAALEGFFGKIARGIH